MFRVDKNEVISELNLSLFGAKGFMQDRNKECPFCNKGGKWGIKFNDAGNNGAFHCFKCGMKTTLKKFLEKIGRKDLIKQDYENTVKMQKLTPLIDDEEEKTTEEIKECTLPKNWNI